MALKSVNKKSDKDMWFQFPDAHFEKCEKESAEKMWPDQYFVKIGTSYDALRLRAIQLIDNAGRYGRFDTLAYYQEGDLQFQRFEKVGRNVEYVFKNVHTDDECVKSFSLNMKEVNALHEVISDCWDSLQYERVCRGMNYHGGLYHDDKVSQDELDEAFYESCTSLRMFGIDIGNDKNSPTLDKYGEPFGVNLAGNGIYTLNQYGADQLTLDSLMVATAMALEEKGIKIRSWRSGGQTGIDETVGAIGEALGVPVTVHAPANYAFRGTNGIDVKGDENSFKARFSSKDYDAIKSRAEKLLAKKNVKKVSQGLTQ